MYNYLDSSGFIACIYFPILVVMGSFFFLNLFLAVITDTFSENSQKQLLKSDDDDLASSLVEDEKLKKQQAAKNQAVTNLMNLTKKKAEVSKGGIRSFTDGAMMALAKQRMLEE